jgi:hypothetical protein
MAIGLPASGAKVWNGPVPVQTRAGSGYAVHNMPSVYPARFLPCADLAESQAGVCRSLDIVNRSGTATGACPGYCSVIAAPSCGWSVR